MKAGKMDREIQLQSLSTVADAVGHPTPTFTTYATVWAEVREATGAENLQFGRENASGSALFLIRFTSSIKTTDRIRYQNKSFDIISIREIAGRDSGLEVLARVPSNE